MEHIAGCCFSVGDSLGLKLLSHGKKQVQHRRVNLASCWVGTRGSGKMSIGTEKGERDLTEKKKKTRRRMEYKNMWVQ